MHLSYSQLFGSNRSIKEIVIVGLKQMNVTKNTARHQPQGQYKTKQKQTKC